MADMRAVRYRVQHTYKRMAETGHLSTEDRIVLSSEYLQKIMMFEMDYYTHELATVMVLLDTEDLDASLRDDLLADKAMLEVLLREIEREIEDL